MRFQKITYTFILACLLQFGVSAQNDDSVELNSFYDSLSFTLGVESALKLVQESDKFNNLNKFEVVRGFQEHIFGEKVSPECDESLKKFLGDEGLEFNTQYLAEGSHCIGEHTGHELYVQLNEFHYWEDLDVSKVIKGFKAGMFKTYQVHLSVQQKESILRKFGSMLEVDFYREVERKDQLFWKEVFRNPNVKQAGETGIYFEIIEEGNDGFPNSESDIEVQYILTNTSGDTLDNSYDREMNLKINLSALIAGWREAFPYLQKGGRYRLFIPWEKAYKGANLQAPQGALCYFIEFIDFGPKGTIAKPIPTFSSSEEE